MDPEGKEAPRKDLVPFVWSKGWAADGRPRGLDENTQAWSDGEIIVKGGVAGDAAPILAIYRSLPPDASNYKYAVDATAREPHRRVTAEMPVLQASPVAVSCAAATNAPKTLAAPGAASASPAERQVIGVEGKWYDVGAFLDKHPGGDVIREFVGRDATMHFRAFHDPDVLRGRVPCGTYAFDPDAPNNDKADGVWLRMDDEFRKRGFYETSMPWFATRVLIVAGFLAAAGVLVSRFSHWFPHLLSAVCLAAFWQQSGFLMHDFMHGEIFHARRVDRALGSFFGTVCFGVSGSWWRDEHYEHHAFTCTAIKGVGCSDPQMDEVVWRQNPLVFEQHPWGHAALRLLLAVQHVVFLPTLIFVGPLAIKLDSLICERRPLEFLCFAVHWAWTSVFLSFGQFSSWGHLLLYFYLANCFVGVLEIQLLISHYSKEFIFKVEAKDGSRGWCRRQLSATKDISAPEWLDWFHGGLNIHTSHHLFPRMPRNRFREARAALLGALREAGVKDVALDEVSFSRAVAQTIAHLRRMPQLFSIDPR